MLEFPINFLTGAGITYLIVGLTWSIIFTGILAFKITGGEKWDCLAVVAIVSCFFINWIGWPWGIKHNLPYLIP